MCGEGGEEVVSLSAVVLSLPVLREDVSHILLLDIWEEAGATMNESAAFQPAVYRSWWDSWFIHNSETLGITRKCSVNVIFKTAFYFPSSYHKLFNNDQFTCCKLLSDVTIRWALDDIARSKKTKSTITYMIPVNHKKPNDLSSLNLQKNAQKKQVIH